MTDKLNHCDKIVAKISYKDYHGATHASEEIVYVLSDPEFQIALDGLRNASIARGQRIRAEEKEARREQYERLRKEFEA